ncbi:cytochrome b/b6 domain-containing protein [Cryobacterium flavum]|uniref:cytochrome b/b6 domain-containing protein n=1 Tax=Cryobacterium flavum TaxID=1424659 RepID=UPI001FCAB0F4|nr:cytochrome b/b6 domain-containing protein [Cryobacterium flavum]
MWVVPAAIVFLAAAVLAAKALRDAPAIASFIAQYPGQTELPAGAPVGLPWWLGWQHFLNMLFLLLIIRSGLEVRNTKRPAAYWIRGSAGLIRTKGTPNRISLSLWFHLSIDALWVLNGIVFYVIVFATGHWMRIIPVSWDVFPNAVSVGIQYLSLNWPTENGWVNYNALQLLSYFMIVFIAAPLAIITGLRMSPAWPKGTKRLNAIYPVQAARAIHFPLMLVFVAFIITHVALVMATGALRNLNHMYASREDGTWWGFGIFAASVVVMTGAWFAASPIVLRAIAARTGSVTR